MIYLFTQMLVSLALAAVVGGAVGWLLHRARAVRHVDHLNHTIYRQQQQVKQAQTDVAMLTDDYDELKQQTRTEIETLRQENKDLAPLHQNLEKSQLLVRQLMQKHEAQLRDISTKNEAQAKKLKVLEDREQAFNKAQAELDLERRKNRALLSGAATGVASSTITSAVPSTAVAMSDTAQDLQNDDEQASTAQPDDEQASAVVDGDSLVGGGDTPSQQSTSQETTSQETTSQEQEETAAMIGDNTSTDEADVDTDDGNGSAVSENIDEANFVAADDIHDSATEPATADHAQSDDVEPLTTDDDTDDPVLFEPVQQHDDLKQIFGIGPVTEKKLNDLGITSYSQLAELKRHEVEKIADALQIFPQRIEQDNWIESARRQLEEVLEEL